MSAWIRALSLLAITLAASCGGGGGDSGPRNLRATPATAQLSDPQASAETRAVMKYLAALSNREIPGVIAGQNTGHGSQINDISGFVGYATLVASLQKQSGETPALVGLDYEHDQIFTPAQLAEANQTLIRHWNAGGLVTLNWSPQNPWLNDESDLAAHPGVWTDTRTSGPNGDNMAGVDLRQLVDPSSAIFPVWRRKLDRIAVALQQLQQAGVVVLWRPMQEMNGNWFWWGSSTHASDPAPYTALWQDMHRYFTDVKGLHNLIWVYSPAAGGGGKPVQWAYPGDAYVDVVAGTSYDDGPDIADYASYLGFGKPLGMGEFGPMLGGAASLGGTFDDTRYATRLHTAYPAIAYWLSWHDYPVDDKHAEHLSIVSQLRATELLRDGGTLTVSRLGWKAYR